MNRLKKLTGTWRGTYGYRDPEEMAKREPVSFTLTLKQGWFGRFTGSVTEDPTRGMPGTGLIYQLRFALRLLIWNVMHSHATTRPGEWGKVTVVEFMWVTLLIGGAAAGAIVGHAWFGFWGGAIGLPIGIGAGLILCCVIAYFLSVLVPPNPTNQQKTRRL
jgi:hypothetical protein